MNIQDSVAFVSAMEIPVIKKVMNPESKNGKKKVAKYNLHHCSDRPRI